MKKTTLIGLLWVAGIATGTIAQFTDMMYFAFLTVFLTGGAGFATVVYVTDNWYRLK